MVVNVVVELIEGYVEVPGMVIPLRIVERRMLEEDGEAAMMVEELRALEIGSSDVE